MFLVDQDTKLDKTRVISAKEIFENMTARDIAEDELISSIKAALSDRVVAVEAIPEPSKPDSEDVLPEAAAVEQVSQVVSEPMEANPSGDQ